MPRIKIQLPEKLPFTTQIPVRVTDLNFGNHVGNDSFLSIIHEARLQFLKNMGYTELSFEGCGLIMADVGIEYLHESFYGDILEIHIGISDIKRVSFDINYFFETIREGEKIPILKAKTGMVCFNFETHSTVSLPSNAIEKFDKNNYLNY